MPYRRRLEIYVHSVRQAYVVPRDTLSTPEALQTPEDGPSWLQLLLCKKCFEKRAQSATTQPVADTDATESKPDAKGVAALVAIATDAVEDERERGRVLDGTTASLAGFTGLILYGWRTILYIRHDDFAARTIAW